MAEHEKNGSSAADAGATSPAAGGLVRSAVDDLGDAGTLTVEPQRFAIVPEWLLDADIGDCAVRLYAVLLRYGQTSGSRMPSRALLARRLRKGSVDTVDRAMKELVALGAVTVERRRSGRVNLTNRYHLRASDPSGPGLGGRSRAATPVQRMPLPVGPPSAGPAATAPPLDPVNGPSGRIAAATPGRSNAATVAAEVRPDPEVFTQSNTSSPSPHSSQHGNRRDRPGARAAAQASRTSDLLDACVLPDLDSLVARCQQARRDLGQPTGRWTGNCLTAALHLAVVNRGWPATHAAAALLAVASDPTTRSPMRLAEAGPWWDLAAAAPSAGSVGHDVELTALEAQLDAQDGRRVLLQRTAREQLNAEGQALTRLSVARRAVHLLAPVAGRQTADQRQSSH